MTKRLAIIFVVGAVGLTAAGAALYWFERPAVDERDAAATSRVRETTPAAPPPAPGLPERAGRPAAPAARTTEPPAAPEPAAPTSGTLIIESDVPETSVFLDRVYLGTAPVTARDVTPGMHQLHLSPTGYESIAETIDVTPGTRTIAVSFKAIRLDESIAVVHKHAFGSCAGTLRATPQGLKYDTTNANDAFTASLTDLETFEVDYLDRNLKVKVRGGRTFNFTDPEEQADRLFVFHRAVEKVRQRLLSGKHH